MKSIAFVSGCVVTVLAAHGQTASWPPAGELAWTCEYSATALPHEGVQYVRQGILDATFLYPTGGREAVDTALKLLDGESVPKSIVLGTRRFTRANVEQGGQALP